MVVPRDLTALSAAAAAEIGRSPKEGACVALLSAPEAILTPDGGTLELADQGDATTAALVLRRLAEELGATLEERYYRDLFGDTEREREYWWLDIRGHRYMVLRCTAPEAPPGICVGGPIDTPEALALFRAVAASFGAVVQDRRPRAVKPWWRFW
jgi:hypothetical protein